MIPPLIYLDTFGAFGGVGRCSLELLPYLAPRVGHLVVAGRSHVVDSYKPHLAPNESLQFLNLEKPRLHPGSLAIRALARTRPSSPKLTRLLFDRIYATAGSNVPILINYPQTLTAPGSDYNFHVFIHDLNWRLFPDNFSDPQEIDRRCRDWVQSAKLIFTNSEFTRREVIEAYGANPDRVIAAPLAPPARTLPQPDNETLALLQKLGLEPGRYFFFPSVHGRHKGHDVLADALAACDSKPVLPVVVTIPIIFNPDRYPPSLHPYLVSLAEKLVVLEREKKIVSLPPLPWDQMMAVANQCRAYVLPSRYEGFGFPLVEAMSLGKYAICSNIPAYMEILARYGPLIFSATFRSGDTTRLRDLLIRESTGSNALPARLVSDKASTLWGWPHTSNAIAEALEKN